MNAASDGSYELPPDQRLDDDADPDEPAELMPYERAQELAEHFEDIGRRTIAPGVVLGRVVSIDSSKNNAKIAVDVDVPAETDAQRTFFDKPKSWDRGYAFVRFVEGYGYERSNFAAMIQDGVEVKVKREADDYEIIVPRNATERAKGRMAWLTTPLREVAHKAEPDEVAVILPLSSLGAWISIWFNVGFFVTGDVGLLSVFLTFMGALGALMGAMVGVIVGSVYFDW